MRRRRLGLAAWALSAALASTAHATTPQDEHAAAVESFRRGTQLVQLGKLQDAIDAFRAALAHEPSGVGARLDLADCYEKVGAPAQAWRQYALAAVHAARAGDARVAMARASSEHLEPQLLKLLLRTHGDDGLEVRVDGEPIEPPLVAGGALAVSPGRHRIEATAPGKQATVQEVAGAAGQTLDVTLSLEPRRATPVERVDTVPSNQRTWALVVGGAGVAVLAAGAVTGLVAAAKKSSLEHESTDPALGASRFDADLGSAKTFADVSTALFVVGGVAVAAGLTLWIAAPSARATSLGVRVGPGAAGIREGAAVVGTF